MPIVLLDSTPLGLLTYPSNDKKGLDCKKWVKNLVHKDIPVAIPQVIDYELRRELIRIKRPQRVEELDNIESIFPLDLTTEEVTKKAAQLWAWARNTGQQTAHDKDIDIDVILAAHAIVLAQREEDYVVVATGNVKHLVRYTPAMHWSEITVENCIKPKAPILSRRK